MNLMKRLIIALLCAAATLAHAQTKKELVQKLLTLQQPMIEGMARSMVERPAAQLMQAAGQALQSQVPPEKREAAAKQIDADVKKFVEESTPLLRERAVKLAPSTLGATLEEKFTEDELKQLIAWLESPVNKKFQQIGPEMQNNFLQKLAGEAAPLLDPKLQALQQKVRVSLGLPEAPPPAAANAAPKAAAAAPASAASAAKAKK
jgi:uncharacterized protein